MKKNCQKWSDDELLLLREMAEGGFNDNEIAKALDEQFGKKRTPSACCAMASLHGIRVRMAKPKKPRSKKQRAWLHRVALR